MKTQAAQSYGPLIDALLAAAEDAFKPGSEGQQGIEWQTYGRPGLANAFTKALRAHTPKKGRKLNLPACAEGSGAARPHHKP